ncbi:MAG TPA: crossover junction endodeoxyribonuclease RuvC, partial [Gaiellaceae bacterium]|nr:crossover junction endodeoxyribonuclease RuvC [Gaiellaceae bacterium]
MKVLGIDPGTAACGYGIVHGSGQHLRAAGSGCWRTSPRDPIDARLLTIFEGVRELIAEHEPDAVAIEAIFHHKSAASALLLGHARGVALLAAGQCGYAPFEYNPMTVKRSVGAHGRADKKAVARMVGLLLGETVPG